MTDNHIQEEEKEETQLPQVNFKKPWIKPELAYNSSIGFFNIQSPTDSYGGGGIPE
jgi:hypothetical protein